ncbi:MAG: HEAT repeat domain-containing protein [Anaerolineae bacterium]|nr:HEAT repeat domain-containing protein [Anaerolineae bacterium]
MKQRGDFGSGVCGGGYYFGVNFVWDGFICCVEIMADTKHIFISYAREDGAAFAQKLDDALRTKGFPTWRDTRGIDPAKDFTAEIEIAIKMAQCIVACITPETERDNSFVRREIQYALVVGKPVIVVKVDAKTPPPIHVINNTWVEFYKGWDVAFNQLNTILQKSSDDYHSAELSPKTADPFRPYLENLYERIVRFLDQAVIKLIDLTPEATPEAVNIPLVHKDMLDLFFEAQGIGEENPSKPQPFHTFTKAFEHYKGRTLLLGEPGAGKTITLFAFARDAVARRLSDLSAPLPIMGLISSWNAMQQISLADWLTEGYTELDAQYTKATIEEGKALLLLDGLDELGGEQELSFNNETEYNNYASKLGHVTDTRFKTSEKIIVRYDPRKRFMSQISKNNLVTITCRIKDYAAIGQKISLNGAVTLRELDSRQMQLYLTEQPELWAAAQADKGLKAMLQTPLLLSFFAFAYRGMTSAERQQLSDLSQSPVTLRNTIFEYYVRERFRHEVRKRGRKLNYDYQTVNTILGAVASEDAIRGKENQIHIQDIQKTMDHDPTDFIQQCQELHMLVNLDNTRFRFLHLRLRDCFAVEPLITNLRKTKREDSAKALGRIGDARAVDVLIDSLEDPSLRSVSVEALAQIGIPSIQSLTLALKNNNADVRRSITGTLGRIASPRAIDPLIGTLQDIDPSVRASAVWALGHIGDKRALEALIKILSDEDAAVRVWGARALENIGDERAIDALIQVLSDEDVDVRRSVVETLGRIGDERAIDALIQVLSDKNADTRRTTAEALGRIKSDRAVNALIVSLTDHDVQVRYSSAKSLAEIGLPSVEALIKVLNHPNTDLQYDAIRVLTSIGAPVINLLIEMLKNKDPNIQNKAVNTLRRIGTPEALQAMKRWEEQDKKQ